MQFETTLVLVVGSTIYAGLHVLLGGQQGDNKKKEELVPKGTSSSNIVFPSAKEIRSENKGLISTDRGTKTTLMRTIPRSILSRIQRICPFQYLQMFLSPTPHHFQVGG